jgi:hypothetical protein
MQVGFSRSAVVLERPLSGASGGQADMMHWPAPIVAQDVELGGRSWVTVEYRIDPRHP